MVLPKESREAIHKASGPVWIVWPESAAEPQLGHEYTVQSSYRKAGDSRIEVVQIEAGEGGGWKAQVRIAEQQFPCHISARQAVDPEPMGGPQFRPSFEAEQVDPGYQELLSVEGTWKTIRLGHEKRELDTRRRRQKEVIRQQRKGKSGKLAMAALARSDRRLSEGASECAG